MESVRVLQRPIRGGVFGEGRYCLASMPCVVAGLHATKYMVVEPKGGAVLAIAEDKVQALAGARRVLHAANDAQALPQRLPEQLQLWPGERVLEVLSPRRVSRRRRVIFERTQGRCHYCGVGLQIDGAWHVEHMMPRALGGGDNALNLVAACVSCNLSKGERTAFEFVAGGG